MAKTERPLLKDKTEEEMKQFIAEQLEKREPYYNQAKHIFDVNLLENFDKIKISVTKLRDLLGI